VLFAEVCAVEIPSAPKCIDRKGTSIIPGESKLIFAVERILSRVSQGPCVSGNARLRPFEKIGRIREYRELNLSLVVRGGMAARTTRKCFNENDSRWRGLCHVYGFAAVCTVASHRRTILFAGLSGAKSPLKSTWGRPTEPPTDPRGTPIGLRRMRTPRRTRRAVRHPSSVPITTAAMAPEPGTQDPSRTSSKSIQAGAAMLPHRRQRRCVNQQISRCNHAAYDRG
jgi:hypothetical protein